MRIRKTRNNAGRSRVKMVRMLRPLVAAEWFADLASYRFLTNICMLVCRPKIVQEPGNTLSRAKQDVEVPWAWTPNAIVTVKGVPYHISDLLGG